MAAAQPKSFGVVSALLPLLHGATGGSRSPDPTAAAKTAAALLTEKAAALPSPLQVSARYGALLDTLYRCLLTNEGGTRQGRELVLLHKAHVASYRAAGLLGSPHSLPHDPSAAAVAEESVEESVERLTVQLDAALSPPTSPDSVDVGVFSDSDWSDDDGDDSEPPQKADEHRRESLKDWLRPSAAAVHHAEHHDKREHHHSAAHSSEHDGKGDKEGHVKSADVLLLERLLLLYVDVFCDQSEAFAPFTKRDRTVPEDARLLYEHLTQKTHKASAFHSLARNLRWRSVKSHLLHFFTQELEGRRRGAAQPANSSDHEPASATHTSESRSSASSTASLSTASSSASSASPASGKASAVQPPPSPQPAVPPPSKSRVRAALSSLYHGAADRVPKASPFTSGQAPFAPSPASPAPHPTPTRSPSGSQETVIGPGADYLRLLNVACSELHALYAAASSTVSGVLEAQVLTPAAFQRFDRCEDLNAAVMAAMHSSPVTELIAAYHAAYEKAVLTFPGYVLMSRTMRHRIESDAAFLPPATFTDLIIAVHGVASSLIAAFQALVAANATAAMELLTSSEQLRALRAAHQGERLSREAEVESVSAWLYDSRVYPKPLSAETFSMLALVQVGDAALMRELAAERFDEAVERLRALSEADKAALLASLAVQRAQQREAQVSHDVASASRASHLGLSTASFSLRDSTSDSVRIEMMANDNDTDAHTAEEGASTAALEPISPNPNAKAPMAPHLQPKKGDSKKEEKSVQLDDVVKWVDISPQYVVGLGRDDDYSPLRAFAVYDKTFTEPKFENLKDVLVTGLTTRAKIHSNQLHKAATHSSKTMVDFVEAVLFSSATASESVQVGPDFFADPLIVWREGKQPHDVRAIRQPLPFNDIDWLQMVVDSPALTGILHSLGDIDSLVDGDSDVRRPLAHSHFVPQLDAKSGAVTGFLLPLHRSRTARPVKVVDLKYPNSSYAHSAARATYTNAIKGALSDSPIYGPSQAINAALERIFDFTDVLHLEKQAQALLLVAEAIDGHPKSPFAHSVLTRADLDSAIFYLLRSNIMLSAVFVNLFTHNARLTQNYLAHIHAKRDHSLEQLRKRQLTVLPLSHSYFALCILRDAKSGRLTRLKLFVLGFTKLGRSAKPHCAVDFLRPTRETKKRLALQYLLTGANFLYIPFPGANGLPKIIYKELVVREQNRRQMWEAGLLAHIQHYPGELSALFAEHLHVSPQSAALLEEQAVLVLQDRKLSPLDFDVVEREQHRDVVETWLEHQDHDYRRIQPKAKGQQPPQPGVLLNADQMLQLATPEPGKYT